MDNKNYRKYIYIVLALAALAVLVVTLTSQELKFDEMVIAGSPEHFAEVRHVVLKGTNFEIGKKLAEVAQRHGTQIASFGDPLLNRVKRKYMKNNYSIMHERMRGVAATYGLDFDDDAYDFTNLPYNLSGIPGCSVVFYPKDYSKNGHNILSRNYDFSTGNIQGRYPEGEVLPVMSRPYLIEMYPDRGYPSIALHCFDLLSGLIDGINSEGLTVAILAESESVSKVGREGSNEVGMAELSAMRYLLDNCKNVEEAKEAMLTLKHFYGFIPCHYIIADQSGKSFIFEFSPNRNRSYIIDGQGPQCITNHLVFHHPEIGDVSDKNPGDSLRRFKTLGDATSEKKKYTLEEMEAINNRVAVAPSSSSHPEYAPGRTLWYAQYDLDELTLTVRFYLREKPDPNDESKMICEYSKPQTFKLRH
ncbi:C45 family autoproteolytic acyltransferase/hydrolase [Acidobacteriota bacterium]